MNTSAASDHDDFARLQRGDETALNAIVERWQRRLHAFAWRYLQNDADATDLATEALVRLYQQRQRLRPDTNLGAWLFTTLARLCQNQQRWRRRHGAESFDTVSSASANPPELTVPAAAGEMLDRGDALAALARAIERLPHAWRTALLLHHYEGWSYRAIGDVVGCSERGVETRLYRAREQLRRELAPQLQEDGRVVLNFSPARPD